MRPSRKRAIEIARKGDKNMGKNRISYVIFENTVDFIQDTLDMLDKVGKANDKAVGLENHETDLATSVLIVEAAIKEGKRPEGCPADYDLSRFTDLVALENALRKHGAKL